MAGEGYTVTTKDLADVGDSLIGFSGKVRDLADRLERLKTRVDNTWEMDSKKAFDKIYTDFKKSVMSAEQVITKAGTFLKSAKDKYEKSDASGVQILGH